jgi:hypothetical protein
MSTSSSANASRTKETGERLQREPSASSNLGPGQQRRDQQRGLGRFGTSHLEQGFDRTSQTFFYLSLNPDKSFVNCLPHMQAMLNNSRNAKAGYSSDSVCLHLPMPGCRTTIVRPSSEFVDCRIELTSTPSLSIFFPRPHARINWHISNTVGHTCPARLHLQKFIGIKSTLLTSGIDTRIPTPEVK